MNRSCIWGLFPGNTITQDKKASRESCSSLEYNLCFLNHVFKVWNVWAITLRTSLSLGGPRPPISRRTKVYQEVHCIPQQLIINSRENWKRLPTWKLTRVFEDNTNYPDCTLHTIYFFQMTTLYHIFKNYSISFCWKWSGNSQQLHLVCSNADYRLRVSPNT